MVDSTANRVASGLQAREQAASRIAEMLTAAEKNIAAAPPPLSLQQREMPPSPEKLARFKELSDSVRDIGTRPLDRTRPSVPGRTDRLPPACDGSMTRADNHVSKLHTEVKLHGKVVARIYNSGAAEFADDYAYLGRDFRGETLTGPGLAEQRLAKVRAALEHGGAIIADGGNSPAGGIAKAYGKCLAEILRAGTAQTQQEWLAFKATEPPPPGAFLSRTA
jgi:hypothetical protein